MTMLLTWTVAAFFFTSLCDGLSSPQSAGTEFVTAFMENIAYYYRPVYEHVNRLYISALRSGTQVNVSLEDQSFNETYMLEAGDNKEVTLPGLVGLGGSNTSYKTVRVISNFPVIVFSINKKDMSFDTDVVQPMRNLGTEYRLASPALKVDVPFRFVIINTQVANMVMVTHSSQEPLTVTLGPYQNAVFKSPKHPATTRVTAKTPVAVLFGHPCILQLNCSCGLAFGQLAPVPRWGTVFVVPALNLWGNRFNQTLLLVTSDGTNPESVLLSQNLRDTSTTAPELMSSSLYHQAPKPVSISLLDFGFMALIPEESFSTCYLVYTSAMTENRILIVVKTADREGIRLGEHPLPSGVTWAQVDSSDYSVGLVSQLGAMNRAIWHLTSRFGVYIIGKFRSSVFGSPAPSLKVEPDGSKCRVLLGDVILVQEEKNWADAQEHCWGLNSQLADLSRIVFLQHVNQKLQRAQASVVWVGLRRSLLSGEWRWLAREPVEYSKWASGQPNTSLTTQCATMTLEPMERITWSAASCCLQLPFICFEPGNEMPFP